MEMDLGNKWKGQFFTPMAIAELMAEVSIDHIKETIEKDGYITVNEPAAGAGAMVIALANVLKKHGYNYQKQMVAITQDHRHKVSLYVLYTAKPIRNTSESHAC